MYDVIDLQKPWLAKKILHYDRYCVETIRCFFKDYGYLRHKKNIILEDNIQNSITSNFNKQPRDALCKNMWNVRAFKSIIKSISHLVPKWLIKFIKRLLY